MTRREFPTAVRKAALARAGGHCEGTGPEVGLEPGTRCGAVLGHNKQIDHVLPDTMGGEPTLDNAQVLCGACWRVKNARDWRDAAKSNRRRDKHSGARAKSRRPVPGSRNTPFKRRFDGSAERRDT